VDALLGDASRAQKELGWTPRTTFVELVREMVTEDDAIATKDALVRKHGYPTFNYHEA
jgi:GDPmannose 4,6-dehydratase